MIHSKTKKNRLNFVTFILISTLLSGVVLLSSQTNATNPTIQSSSKANISAQQIKAMGLSEVAAKPTAPDFTVADLAGKAVKLSSFKGRWVILNFWATWCPPCRVEMPSMEALWKDFKNTGLAMLAVSTGEDAATVNNFVKSNPYSFSILVDQDNVAGELYQIASIPTTYLIDPNGVVVAGKIGLHDWNSPAVRQVVKELLAKK